MQYLIDGFPLIQNGARAQSQAEKNHSKEYKGHSGFKP